MESTDARSRQLTLSWLRLSSPLVTLRLGGHISSFSLPASAPALPLHRPQTTSPYHADSAGMAAGLWSSPNKGKLLYLNSLCSFCWKYWFKMNEQIATQETSHFPSENANSLFLYDTCKCTRAEWPSNRVSLVSDQGDYHLYCFFGLLQLKWEFQIFFILYVSLILLCKGSAWNMSSTLIETGQTCVHCCTRVCVQTVPGLNRLDSGWSNDTVLQNDIWRRDLSPNASQSHQVLQPAQINGTGGWLYKAVHHVCRAACCSSRLSMIHCPIPLSLVKPQAVVGHLPPEDEWWP